jgi:hypothetical protein
MEADPDRLQTCNDCGVDESLIVYEEDTTNYANASCLSDRLLLKDRSMQDMLVLSRWTWSNIRHTWWR